MIITRNIELIPVGNESERKEILHQLYTWRDLVRKAANAAVTHKFVQQNIADFEYLKDVTLDEYLGKDKSKIVYAKDVIKEGPGLSEQNVTYRLISSMLKGKVPSDIFSCLNQSVSQSFKKRYADFAKGKASIPSYANIPIPFSSKALSLSPVTVEYDEKDEETGKTEHKKVNTYRLDFFHLPFDLMFGKDLSGNRTIVKKGLAGEYKFCGSSVMIKDGDKEKGRKRKIFLLLSIDIPVKESRKVEGRTMYAALNILDPVRCSLDREKLLDTGDQNGKIKGVYRIGNRDEFLHRRLRIQAAVRSCQINAKYAKGGHGRKKKCKALNRYHDLEKNYIDYKTHVYSRVLVDIAEKNLCDTIVLINQKTKEENAKKVEFLLRNWSYHGLKTKVNYKAGQLGIKLAVEGKEDNSDED